MAESSHTPESGETANLVVFQHSPGGEVQARVLKLTKYQVVFEIINPLAGLRVSDVLGKFKILSGEMPLYDGRAVISDLVCTGNTTLCEAALEENWLDLKAADWTHPGPALQSSFQAYLEGWGRQYRVLPEYKLAVTDLTSFLIALRNWFEQVELRTQSLPNVDRLQAEKDILQAVMPTVIAGLKSMFERFELAARKIEKDDRAAHAHFCHRLLHPYLLASPFMHRIFAKPLGYAGDYEMVNMILRDPFEGASLFAKALNVFILGEAPAIAHRNRVQYLIEKLKSETFRVSQSGQSAKILNVGCGPAKEVQNFLAGESLSQQADLTLVDFNEETLRNTGKILERVKQDFHRATPVRMVQKSIQQMLRLRGQERKSVFDQYDFIYCAGLLDYLPDYVSKHLIELLYSWLKPGGFLALTNVELSNPIRNIMEFMYEWYLIYRNTNNFRSLAPSSAAPENVRVLAEDTGTNLFLEIRKPLAE
jgi:extracellular factor (EF) 3-hydroxypalmitic acid methyl ester biosynthesis protein